MKEAEEILAKLRDLAKDNPKLQKRVDIAEVVVNCARSMIRLSKRKARLKKAFQKRAYVKSKFYKTLGFKEDIMFPLLMQMAGVQISFIQSKPIPKFKKGGLAIFGEEEK